MKRLSGWWRSMLAAAITLAVSLPSPAGAATACPAVPGVTERCAAWTSSYNNPTGRGGSGEDIVRGGALSPDGTRVFAVGSSYDDATGTDAVVAAFDTATRSLVWSGRYDGPMNGYDTSSAVVVSPDGSKVFATGRSQGPDGDWDFATTAYDAATGQRIWASRYDGAAHLDDRPYTIAVSPDGTTVYAGGTRDDEVGNANAGDYAVVAYSAETGDVRWIASYQGTASKFDIVDKLAASPDGAAVFATGRSDGSSTGADAVTIALDPSDGSELWVARYSGTGAGADEGIDLDVSADGTRLVVAATSAPGSAANDWATIAYDTGTGQQLWAARYNGGANGADAPAAVDVAGDTAYVAGTSAETGTIADFSVAAYRLADGVQVWRSPYSTPGNWSDIPRDLVVSPNGASVYVTGYSLYPRAELQPFEHLEYGSYLTASFATSDGTRRWVARYNSSGYGDDVAQVALVSPSSSTVYAVGTFVYNGVYSLQAAEPPPFSFDYGVVAYSAS